jgi:CDP-paratose 2-epimerase
MKKKYLVTGGCGFLGSNLAAEILKQGKELAVFDNLSRHGSQNNLAWLRKNGQFNFYHGDIRNFSDINRVIQEFMPDVIFHLAGQVAMTSSVLDPYRDFSINALGTVNLLTAAKEHCPQSSIIYSSTNKVYGGLDQFGQTETATRYVCNKFPEGYDESASLDFQSPYGCSKGAADQYMLDFHRMYGMKTVVFRHSSICGVRQFCTIDQGWVGWFVQQALQTLKNPDYQFDICGTGKQVRDVLFAPDIVKCYLAAEANIDKCAGQAFNIGGGHKNSLSIMELLNFLSERLNVKLHVNHLAWRQSDQKIFIANINKAKNTFNWAPAIRTVEGLSDILNWIPESEAAY